jgi:hypothetical protein
VSVIVEDEEVPSPDLMDMAEPLPAAGEVHRAIAVNSTSAVHTLIVSSRTRSRYCSSRSSPTAKNCRGSLSVSLYMSLYRVTLNSNP